ncbi:MAG: hypothetical protein COA38_17765 [Fluviicola sp.]|nr:MAG: hypothetical protein COA38_17765 [Fluviicola sp.]
MKLLPKILTIGLTVFWTLLSSAQYFEEVSDEVGLNYIYPGNDFQMVGGGLMVIDVNNDGWEDFYQAGGVFDSKLWINDKGTFTDGTSLYGLDALKGYFIQGAVCADFDNDGYQDFFIVNYGIGMNRGDKKSPVLLRNRNGSYFDVVKMDSTIGPGNFSAACLGDINNDGFVDIYLTNYVSSMAGISDSNGVEIGYDPTCYGNKLLLNNAGQGFYESAQEYGIDDEGCGLAASFTDVDGDGDLDLLLLNDFGEWTGIGNKYFRNDYPKVGFTDLSDQFGFAREMYGMGIGQGDYDEDGDLDYYVTNIGRNCLFKNEGTSFKEVARDLGIDNTFVYDSVVGTSWSGLFFDLEFDGDLDLYISKGNVAALVPKAALSDANRLIRNDNGIFIDVTDQSGVGDILSHRGAIIFDYDHDGDLDIVSSIVKLPWSAFAKREQKIKLYENESNAKNWVGIKLIGNGRVNRDCFGCSVLFEQDGKKMLREVDAASGQASQSTRIIYYGLNNDCKLDKLTINWTNGEQTVLTKLKKNRVYEVSSNGELSIVKQR